ncbi:hypothetical protein HYC85_025485 [Camellia sinensis]|uniref:Phosphatidylinositol N-acetylglucosaminyltransferase subunit H conserved domain-containing protein n=1 Tax=Camellia sinensis TaxID=4442 RepID=A0A7J7GB57_CAMSI|nr:hypothetical protein HYC85_025485 [Camellia sinensis]
MSNGFVPSYTSWTFHGENLSSPVPHNVNVGQTDLNDGDGTYEILYKRFGLTPPSFIYEVTSFESIIIMPAFGVQLETHYSSGRIIHRFIPIEKILKPVLNECVTQSLVIRTCL